MRTRSFTLILDAQELTDELADQVYSRVDYGLLAQQGGVVHLDADLEAPNALEAVLEAVTDLRAVGQVVLRVEPELVTLADVARLVERTTQSVHQLAAGARGPGGFPRPVGAVKNRTRLYRWSQIASWWEERMGPHPDVDSETAAAIAAVNGWLTLADYEARSGSRILSQQLAAQAG